MLSLVALRRNRMQTSRFLAHVEPRKSARPAQRLPKKPVTRSAQFSDASAAPRRLEQLERYAGVSAQVPERSGRTHVCSSETLACILSFAIFTASIHKATARFHLLSRTAFLTDSSNLALRLRLNVPPNSVKKSSCNSEAGTLASIGLKPPTMSDDSV